MNRIYLDHAATTNGAAGGGRGDGPAARRRLQSELAARRGTRGARRARRRARAVARVLGASPREIVFTGGGSESDVMAIVGAARAQIDRGRLLVTTAIDTTP